MKEEQEKPRTGPLPASSIPIMQGCDAHLGSDGVTSQFDSIFCVSSALSMFPAIYDVPEPP